MSTNCINCVVNKRTGLDLLCDECRALRAAPSELPLTLPDDAELVPALNKAEIAELHMRLSCAVIAMDEARDYLAQIAGPNPGPLAATMLAGINYGTGHFRHCRDVLLRLQRRKNTLEKQP